MRFNKSEDLALYLEINHPELCEDDVLRPKDTVCVRIPVKAPEGSIFRTESSIETLERVKRFATEWILPGHVEGDNTHNVSATISIDKSRMYTEFSPMGAHPPNDSVYKITQDGKFDEWEVVGKWMWDNREVYNGLSVLPAFDHTYKQAPYQEVTKEEYDSLLAKMPKSIRWEDLSFYETEDGTSPTATLACSSDGNCELVDISA